MPTGKDSKQTVTDFAAFGQSVVEEVLFRAGLALSDAAGKAENSEATLNFRVTAIEADRSLELEFDRVSGKPLRIQIALDQ